MPPQKLTKSTTQPMKGGSSRSKNKQKYQKGGVMPDSEFIDEMGDKLIELHNNLSTIVKSYMDHLTEKLTESCGQNVTQQYQDHRTNISSVIDQYVKLNGQGKDTIETVRNAVKNCRLSHSSGYESSGGKKPKKASKQITN